MDISVPAQMKILNGNQPWFLSRRIFSNEHVVAVALFCICMCSCSELRLGVLIPWTQARPVGHFMGSAIKVGLATVKKHNLLPNSNISWVWNDSYCKSTRSFEIAWNWWKNKEVDFIIGPACCVVCEEIGAFLGAVNIPFISYGCQSSFLKRNKEFPTFSSIIPDNIPNQVASAFIQLTLKFKWKYINIVTCMESDHMRTVSNIVREQLEDSDTILRVYYIQSTVWGNKEELDLNQLEKMKKIVVMTKSEAAVIFLLMYNSDVINFLNLALMEDMLDGSYLFITTEMAIISPSLTQLPYSESAIGRVLNGLVSVELRTPTSNKWKKFAEKVVLALHDPVFNISSELPSVDKIHTLAGLLHDAVVLWALGVKLTVENGEDLKDGVTFTKNVKQTLNEVSESEQRKLFIFERNSNETVTYGISILRYGKHFEIFYYNASTNQLIQSPHIEDFIKNTVAQHSLLQEFPECGFNDELCPFHERTYNSDTLYIVFGSLVALAVMTTAIMLIIRKKVMKLKVSDVDQWKISWSDISDGGAMLKEQLGCIAKRTYSPLTDDEKVNMKPMTISVGYYKNNPVAMKNLSYNLMDIKNEEVIQELEQMVSLKHMNINEFYGICLDAPITCIVVRFAQKGSLWDLIRFRDFSLPMEFRLSFAIDVACGMRYLHRSPIESHGHLTSTNCLVDSTWTCKVADFGLEHFIKWRRYRTSESDTKSLLLIGSGNPAPIFQEEFGDLDSHHEFHKLRPLWTSPELLRLPAEQKPVCGTQAGDVYSYGIILQELILKDSPFANELEQLSIEEIVRRLKSIDGEIIRPYVSSISCSNPIWMNVMTSCWDEDIGDRPDFNSILETWRQTNDGKNDLPVDKLLKLLQNHTVHLDNLVTQRKVELDAEKKRFEHLMERMLPRSILEQLATGKKVLPEEFSDVTVFVSDIVAFTELSSHCEPEEIVTLLSSLYVLFDDVMDLYNVYKVEIIGDAYIAASGVPEQNDYHASEIGKMALHILSALSEFKMPVKSERKLKMRIGLNSGPVVGGIVGQKMPHYCLFGDTLVTAEALESSCLPMHILISETTNNLLQLSSEKFFTAYAGVLKLPTKGEINTYYVLGKENFSLSLPGEMLEGVDTKLQMSSKQTSEKRGLTNKVWNKVKLPSELVSFSNSDSSRISVDPQGKFLNPKHKSNETSNFKTKSGSKTPPIVEKVQEVKETDGQESSQRLAGSDVDSLTQNIVSSSKP